MTPESVGAAIELRRVNSALRVVSFGSAAVDGVLVGVCGRVMVAV